MIHLQNEHHGKPDTGDCLKEVTTWTVKEVKHQKKKRSILISSYVCVNLINVYLLQ
jgi:hypothetical protein